MNHLRKFNEAKDSPRTIIPNDILDTLEDICLELKDEGLDVQVGNYITTSPCALIYKYHNHTNIKYRNLINDVIERIKEYMIKKGYNVKVEQYDFYWVILFNSSFNI